MPTVSRAGLKAWKADFNQDGTVDYVDLGIWSANAFNQGTFWEGDANGDGTIDYDDLEIWSSQAFKTQQPLPPANFTNPYTFTGRRYDPETGLYYYRARYYDPKLGRFISRDPIGFEGSKWNLYEYVKAKPTVLTDPTGLQHRDVCVAQSWEIGKWRTFDAVVTGTVSNVTLGPSSPVNLSNEMVSSLKCLYRRKVTMEMRCSPMCWAKEDCPADNACQMTCEEVGTRDIDDMAGFQQIWVTGVVVSSSIPGVGVTIHVPLTGADRREALKVCKTLKPTSLLRAKELQELRGKAPEELHDDLPLGRRSRRRLSTAQARGPSLNCPNGAC